MSKNKQKIIQAELLEEQHQLEVEAAWPTLADLRDWLMLPEVPQHYEVGV